MCGIIGVQTKRNLTNTDSYEFVKKFKNKVESLSHRGPDGSGINLQDHTILGHTRLSIIDLSNDGAQPMTYEKGDYVITFNGEIYNYREIKKDLIGLGYNFSTETDTEVILKGFIEYREKIFNKLNGIFALAIYDNKSKKLLLARDRFGVKPLYFRINDDSFSFASEVRSLRDQSDEISENSKIIFLLFGSIIEPNSIYKDIKSFPAGHYGYVENCRLNTFKFYSSEFSPKYNDSYIKCTKNIKKLFSKAIEKQLMSDAPIGVFLSGGIDSSLITGIASKYKKNLKTISLEFRDQKYNEGTYQKIIASKFKTDHQSSVIKNDDFDLMVEGFIQSMDQPTIDGMNTYIVSNFAKRCGLKAVLSGLGADELFFGYPLYK